MQKLSEAHSFGELFTRPTPQQRRFPIARPEMANRCPAAVALLQVVHHCLGLRTMHFHFFHRFCRAVGLSPLGLELCKHTMIPIRHIQHTAFC